VSFNRIMAGNLFALYPEEESCLVYRKYENQGDWQLEQKNFANYLVNINKIINTNNPQARNRELSQSQTNIEPDSKSLIFDSNFESGNLYAAYKVIFCYS